MFYRSVGEVPRRKHTVFRGPDGNLYHEEMQGEEGFSANQSFMYHRRIPTAITAAETVQFGDVPLVANDPLLPRHVHTDQIEPNGDAVRHRTRLIGNSDVALSYIAADETSPLYRNAVGDELVFVVSGNATLESPFGSLVVRPGDYVLIPTSTTHRWVVGEEPLRLLLIEVVGGGHVRIPSRFLSPMGQIVDGSPYNERDVRGPEGPLQGEEGPVDVFVKTRTAITKYTFAHHPFDVVGWDGYNYPWALNIADYQPMTGKIHIPPPVYVTFEGPGFVVCSFVPRKIDYHPDSLKVPYNHANVDSDEVLFYWDGDFMSRQGSKVGKGSMSVHPAGFIHGPTPGSGERSLTVSDTHEFAVMVDTFKPLQLSADLSKIEDVDYPWSWASMDAAQTQ